MNFVFKIVGYLASIMLGILLIPQVYTTYKTKQVEGISVIFLYFELITVSLWILYGIGFIIEDNIDGLPIIIANSALLINVIILLIMKYTYVETGTTDNNQSEINNVEWNNIKNRCGDISSSKSNF